MLIHVGYVSHAGTARVSAEETPMPVGIIAAPSRLDA
jgi:hypothetical protein